MFKKIFYILILLSFYVNQNVFEIFAATHKTSTQLASELSTEIETGTDSLPIGFIIAWPSYNAIVNDSWLECNGQAVDATLYPKLRQIMANVPNYQGMFLRGMGNRMVGADYYASGGSLNSIQTDTIRYVDPNKTKVVLNTTFGGGPMIVYGLTTPGAAWYEGSDYHGTPRTSWNWWSPTNVTINLNGGFSSIPQSNEIRPVSRAVRYFIKAK